MGRSEKSKRVTWASDVNLCQVKLFLTEDSPAQVGGTQDHLQAKASWSSQSGHMVPDDNLPPGFEGIQPGNSWRLNLSQIRSIKWKRPIRFVINRDWMVVAGEESTETEAQIQRELRVLEAIYPRQSAIPPNPILVGVDESAYNDYNTMRVPITPIEDEEPAIDPSSTNASSSTSTTFLPHTTEAPATKLDPSILAALSSMTSLPGNSIDPNLLVKILSDPKMIEKLVTNIGASQNASSQNRQPQPQPIMSQNIPSTSAQYIQSNVRPMQNLSQNVPNTTLSFYPPPPTTTTTHPISNMRPPLIEMISTPSVPKDINYYKSLIQQHGGERREATSQQQFSHQNQDYLSGANKLRELKPKMTKLCLYFNTARGCKNGANCTFQHDVNAARQRVSGVPDVQASKRMKMDREITGT